jgi:outer membrane protein assembly factor BamB
LFIVAPDRQMTALQLLSGTQVWRSAGTAVRESIGISGDGRAVFVRAMNDLICAFDAASSEPRKLWEANLRFGYDINSAMLAERDGKLFYGTKNGLVFALNARSGALLWKHRVGVGLVNTVLPLPGDRLLLTDFDGQIVLLCY